MKVCAYCAESIQDAAVLCRFCGREQPRSTGENSEQRPPEYYSAEVERRASLPVFAHLKAGDFTGCPQCAKTVRVGVHQRCPHCGMDFAASTPVPSRSSGSHVKAVIAIAVALLIVVALSNLPFRSRSAAPSHETGATVRPTSSIATPATPAPTETVEAKIDPVQCAQDLNCLAGAFRVPATVACKSAVASLANYDFEWTDGLLTPTFSAHRWKDRKRGIVTYVGDSIRFQNGLGAWQNGVYECDFDTATKSAVAARARPGRLAK